MIRFLCFLFNKPYETCKSCETLKQQLAYERDEKQKLTNTLLEIIRPKVVEAAPVELNPINQTAGLFSRRRAVMEAKDRAEAQILAEKRHIGLPDIIKTEYIGSAQIQNLEQELGIEEKEA